MGEGEGECKKRIGRRKEYAKKDLGMEGVCKKAGGRKEYAKMYGGKGGVCKKGLGEKEGVCKKGRGGGRSMHKRLGEGGRGMQKKPGRRKVHAEKVWGKENAKKARWEGVCKKAESEGGGGDKPFKKVIVCTDTIPPLSRIVVLTLRQRLAECGRQQN